MGGTSRKSSHKTAVKYCDLTNEDDDVIITGSRKRNASALHLHEWADLEEEAPSHVTPKKRPKTTSPRKKKYQDEEEEEEEEKRLRQFRTHPPRTYQDRLERALGQRMFVIDRTRTATVDCPEEVVEMAGSTGNIYHVTICKLPHCTCPDNMKGNQCKHIIYVLHNVLKAPEHLQYQVAFLSSELRAIFSLAPALPTSQSSVTVADPDHPSNRKAVDGDCPICFTDMDEATENIVWCKAACGNNIHKTCFDQWACSQSGKRVTCVYCRTPWERGDLSKKELKAKAELNEEGYLNIGEELGLNEERDYSSYYPPWVRRNGYY